jgi:ribosomal protein S20
MKYQDVQMVTSSLDKLGDSLLRNRMMQDQQKARGEDRELRDKDFALREREVTGRDEDRTENRKLREQVMASQQSQQALGQLQSAYDSIARDYDRGVIDRAEANRRAKALVDQIKSAPEMLLSASPFASMLDAEGDLFQDREGKPAPQLTPSNLEGFPGALTPGGAYVPPERTRASTFDTIDYRVQVEALDQAKRAESVAKRSLDGFEPTSLPRFGREKVHQKNETKKAELQEKYNQAVLNRTMIEEELEKIRNRKPNTQATPPAQATSGKKNFEQLLQEAKEALARGVPQEKVAARFKELTGQDLE